MNFMNPIYSRYSKREEITKEEYEKKQAEISAEDFSAVYEKVGFDSEPGSQYESKATYYHKKSEPNPVTLNLLMTYDNLVAQEKAEHHLNTIKNCVVFFVVLSVIGIVASIVLGANIVQAARYIF